MKNISVIGAGTMGNGIAHTFALSGYNVSLIDLSQDRLDQGIKNIESNLERQVKKEKISSETKQETLGRIESFTDLKQGISSADLVVEAATENLDLKLRIFQDMDTHAPIDAILATNTSSISITHIAGATNRADKVIGMHFMNPVPLMKLVEVIRGYNTSDETTEIVMELSKKLGKTPTEVNDYPGFIANRILMPMINEAIESLFQGVAGVQEIDTVMKLGMAHPMGPLELADFIGLDVCLSILEVMYDGFKNPKYAPCPLLVNMVRSGNLGKKSGKGFYDYSKARKAEIVSSQFQ